MDKSKDISVSVAYGIALPLLCMWFISIGGTIGLITTLIFSSIMFLVLIGLTKSLFIPESIGMQLAVVHKNGKMDLDVQKWDEYIEAYDDRMKSILFWVSIVLQLTILATLIHYTPIYISGSYAAMLLIAEMVKWRTYAAIKENKSMWCTAAYVSAIQRSFGNKEEDKSC